MRVKLGWVPRLFSILFIIGTFVCLNVIWTTSSLSQLTSKSTFNASKFLMTLDTVYVTNVTGRADAIKSALATNNDLKFMETSYVSKNISTDNTGIPPPQGPQSFLTTLQLGQLGNNMFQYASLLGLAKINNRKPFFPVSSLVSQVYKISHANTIKEAATWRRLSEAHHGKHESVFEQLPEGNLTLAAYLQSYKYFQPIEKEIRQEFQFKDGTQRRAMGLFKFLRPKIGTRTPIGVHVRRYDLLVQKEVKLGSLTAPRSYFQQAFAWMRSRHGDVVFLVATDDPAWCKENIVQGDDVILLPHSTSDVHLCALAACRHVIMSVGTFGWWAGWLGGGDVIYYTKPYVPGSPKDIGFSKEDFFPLHWIGIGDGAGPADPEQFQSGLQQSQGSSLDRIVSGLGAPGSMLENKDAVVVPDLGGGEGPLDKQPAVPSQDTRGSPDQLPSRQQQIMPGTDTKVSVQGILTSQQKISPAIGLDIPPYPDTMQTGQQKVVTGLDIRGSPEEIRQMLANKGSLQGTSSDQSAGKTAVENPNFAGSPNVQQIGINPNIPGMESRVKLGSGAWDKSLGGMPSAEGQGSTGSSGAGPGSKTVGEVADSALGNKLSPNLIGSVVSSNKLGVAVAQGVAGDALKSNVNPTLPGDGNSNLVKSSQGINAAPSNSISANMASNVNAASGGKGPDPASVAVKVAGTASVVNPAGAAGGSAGAIDPKLGSEGPPVGMGRMPYPDEDLQRVDKSGVPGNPQLPLAASMVGNGQIPTGQSVGNKATTGLENKGMLSLENKGMVGLENKVMADSENKAISGLVNKAIADQNLAKAR